MPLQGSLGAAPAPPTWARVAIHDTVAAIVKQAAYRRDVGSTLLDRITAWIGELIARGMRALGGVPHGRLLATIAAGVIVLLIAARILLAARLRVQVIRTPERGRSRGSRSTDPWYEAEQLAAGGQFTDAAHALYRAVLTMLAAHGLVRLHESKTSGDYVRELRRRSSTLHASFRRFGARYDRAIYGTGKCTAADYAVLLDEARTLAPRRGGERAA
jgi:hypothetical protein